MSKLRCHISISADGFVAGPNQSEENPLGEGGERLHDWIVSLAAWRESHDKQGGEVSPSTPIVEETRENVGAGVMGRNMFGPVTGGDWGRWQWKGWWGDDPPYHYDVFVLTHHQREPVEMKGGTTYHFVTDGIERALERAKESAGGRGGEAPGRARAPHRSGAARGRRSPLRQPRRRRDQARTAPGSRGARRHASQVQGDNMTWVAADLPARLGRGHSPGAVRDRRRALRPGGEARGSKLRDAANAPSSAPRLGPVPS